MESKLSVEINGKELNLPSDFSIDMEDVNPYFNDNESFSYEVPVSIDDNREVFKNVDDVQSDKRLVELENASMRLRINGMPFRSGKLQTSEDTEISDQISISMVSAIKTLTDMIGDKNCQDIPVKDRIQIGEMIGNVQVECEFRYTYYQKSGGKDGFLSWSSAEISGEGRPEYTSNKIKLQALGFSFPGICQTSSGEIANKKDGKPVVTKSFINVSDEYPYSQYCNARVCYTHYKKNMDGTSGDTVSTSDTYDPYYILEADRMQSGICFYVLYFLDCLFDALGLIYDNKDLLSVGDMKRLCFFTTHCKYDVERKYPDKSDYDFQDIASINNWLSSRNTKGSISTSYEQTKKLESVTINGKTYNIGDELPNGLGKLNEAGFTIQDPNISVKANIMNMYANSRNFPDDSVSTVVDSLWASFGIRFLVDYDKASVKAVFIRDLFRDTSEPVVLKCEIIDNPVKLNEKITGVRMRYSAESDNDEKKYNITSGSTDYDTNYDYVDYSQVNTSLDYLAIIKKQSSSDKTCYVDLNTGNRYRIKVNADAENVSELKPAIFEVGGFTGVEIGDCSAENEDYIIELISDFEPIIPNDVNGKKEKQIGSSKTSTLYSDNPSIPDEYKTIQVSNVNATDREQILAMYVDEDMWHENIPMTIQNAIGSDHADFYLNENLTTDEAYDVTSSEDGNSPLQTIDWGLAIGVMRGGGSDATIQTYDWNYDGHGNSKWRTVAGKYTISSDSMDNWGSQYDYNGSQTGVGDDERYSLKIRSYIEKDGKILCNEDQRDDEGNIETKVRTRGLYDTFMSEYAHFLLHRKKLQVKFRCEVAELANIQWGKRYNIGGYIGWINKLSYTISAEEGLGVVTAEIYQI